MQLRFSISYDVPAPEIATTRNWFNMLSTLPAPAAVRCVRAAMADVWSSVQALKVPGQGHKQVCRPPWAPARLCCRVG